MIHLVFIGRRSRRRVAVTENSRRFGETVHLHMVSVCFRRRARNSRAARGGSDFPLGAKNNCRHDADDDVCLPLTSSTSSEFRRVKTTKLLFWQENIRCGGCFWPAELEYLLFERLSSRRQKESKANYGGQDC